jgi:exopolyphosphatase / guanosine-5'-triphosphate,3'-diphosphate pyrophosphatase
MIIASIDIGTNTILLLVAEVSDNGSVRVLHDEQGIARLGTNVDANRMLARDAMERAAGFLRRYKHTALSYGAERIVAVGTSALRDAGNSLEFCAFIADTVGLPIEILPGEDEARWTFRGGIAEFAADASVFSVLDIGGGSTEVIVGTADTILSKHSFDVGCVRVTERFLHSSPPTHAELRQARLFIEETFAPVPSLNIPATFAVAVAGTVTTMAALHQQLPSYEPEKVTGFRLDRAIVGDIFASLKQLTHGQIRALPQVSDGRADIILAGIMIAEAFMEMAGIPEVIVSDRGLRYGIVYREIEAHRGAGGRTFPI